MLASLILGADFSRGCARPATQPPISATHPHPATQKNRSPIARAPDRRGSRPELTCTALQLRVDVDQHPSSARAPLAGYPRTTLHVVHTPLKASQAGALLLGTRSWSDHDLTPSTRRHRGRGGRLCCGCRLAFRSCVPTPDSLPVPRRSSPP